MRSAISLEFPLIEGIVKPASSRESKGLEGPLLRRLKIGDRRKRLLLPPADAELKLA